MAARWQQITPIMRTSQLGALIKYTSRLEGNNIVSNRTNLIHTSNKYCNKYNRVVYILWANQSVNSMYLVLTIGTGASDFSR